MVEAPATPAGPAMAEWLTTFRAFGPEHAITAGLCALAMIVAAIAGRAWRGSPRERALRVAWAWSIVAFQALMLAWYFWPANYDPAESWPLHLCDLAAWVAAAALLSGRRSLRAVLYFWAIGLSTQAYFTPVLTEGPAHPKFWFFWVGHTQIVGSAVYDVVAGGFRPRWRDYAVATAANLVYAAIVLPIDVALGLNYGYLGDSSPDRPTLIDRLGPWPGRLVVIFLLTQGVMLVLWAAWIPLGRRGGGARPAAAPAP